MKKKMTAVFVMALILALAAATALAVTAWNARYEKIIEIQGGKEFFRDLDTNGKIALVEVLVETGAEMDADKLAALRSVALSEADKDALAVELVQRYYGEDSILTTFDMMVKDRGAYSLWPLDFKYWFRTMVEKYAPQGSAAYQAYVAVEKALMPGPGDMSEDQAVAFAKSFLSETFGLTEEDYSSMRMGVSYWERHYPAPPEDIGTACVWQVSFHGDGFSPCHVTFLNDGTVHDYNDGRQEIELRQLAQKRNEWYLSPDRRTIEGMAAFAREFGPKYRELVAQGEADIDLPAIYMSQIPYGLPTGEDVPQAEAEQIALATLHSLPEWSDEFSSQYELFTSYRVYNEDAPEWRFAWTFPENEETSPYSEGDGGKFPEYQRLGAMYRFVVHVSSRTGEVIRTEAIGHFFPNGGNGEIDEDITPGNG